jgi:hypothetical protein
MVLLLWSCCRGLVVVAIVIVAIVSIVVSIAFVVAVVIDRHRHRRLHCCHLLSPSWRRSNGSAEMGAAIAEKVVAQQWQWRRSNGNGGAATAMAVQRRLRWRSDRLSGAAMALAAQRRLWRRSNGNGDGGAAMGVAVVVAAQQWRRSNCRGGAAMVVDRSHRTIELYTILCFCLTK